MNIIRSLVFCSACAAGISSTGCNTPLQSPASPTAVSHSTPSPAASVTGLASSGCLNVLVEGVAPLTFIEIAPGIVTLGAGPSTVTIGGITGDLSSIATSSITAGAKEQGAQHLTLRHTFSSPAGTFVTDDRAVCAPAGTDPTVCRVNDVLNVVSGTGVFANASGMLHNHAEADLKSMTLTYTMRGRICGQGL
jgi:hypothetical protein